MNGVLLVLFFIVIFLYLFVYRYHSSFHNTKVKNINCWYTFDDGPSENSLKIASLLEAYNQRGIFLVNGTNIPGREKVVKELYLRGHIIGVHGYDHIHHVFKGYNYAYDSFKKTADLIENITGEYPVYYRPPYGWQNYLTIRAASDLNLTHLGWGSEGHDWDDNKSVKEMVEMIYDQYGRGDIILLHEHPKTIEVLKIILPKLSCN